MYNSQNCYIDVVQGVVRNHNPTRIRLANPMLAGRLQRPDPARASPDKGASPEKRASPNSPYDGADVHGGNPKFALDMEGVRSQRWPCAMVPGPIKFSTKPVIARTGNALEE